MSDLILTGWTGTDFAEIAAHTLPIMRRYAIRHNLDFACANLLGARPPSWNKVQALHTALQRHDRVAWVDADVVIVDGSENILSELEPGKVQALCRHSTECGEVPNCGVWVLTKQALPVLAQMWAMDRYLNHCWWEQRAMLELLGYEVGEVNGAPSAKHISETELFGLTTWLGSQWNDHPQDSSRVREPFFFHVTMYADRLHAVKTLAERTNV